MLSGAVKHEPLHLEVKSLNPEIGERWRGGGGG